MGARLGVPPDAPTIDLVYKLVDIDGRPVLKLSAGKATLPGPKQVWRRLDGDRFAGDLIALANEPRPPDTVPLLEPAMQGGARVVDESLDAARARAAQQRRALPAGQRSLDAEPYPVEVSPALTALRDSLAQRHAPA